MIILPAFNKNKFISSFICTKLDSVCTIFFAKCKLEHAFNSGTLWVVGLDMFEEPFLVHVGLISFRVENDRFVGRS